MNITTDTNLALAINRLRRMMITQSKPVRTERWQGIDATKPEMAMHELQHVNINVSLAGREDIDYYQRQIQPNLPWADDHFEERVCGEPINPGIEWANWPWGHSAEKFLDANGKFNHNYMERYWPKYAGLPIATKTAHDYAAALHEHPTMTQNLGIYHRYGDLRDVVHQLVSEPHTRQAMLPVFFPEDTGAVHRGRIPCSIAYQFFMREGKLDIVYWLRSCDLFRHMRDDIYLTCRLLLWMLDECRKADSMWKDVSPGRFVMFITSLHVFRNDFLKMGGS